MKIGIYYFSGTGNTRFVAEKLQQAFEQTGMSCDLIPMEAILKGEQPLHPEAYHMVGIGFPVHAFDAPTIVYDFLALLPKARISYFLFKTAGDKFLGGGSTQRLRKVLADKAWKLSHESFFVMPANMASKAKAEKISLLVRNAKAHALRTVAEILSGGRKVLPDTSAQRLFSRINRLESRGCKMASRHWLANSNCTLCGLCVRDCPTQNISVKGSKIEFGDKCIFCLRCWWNCPVRAIDHPYAKQVLLKQPYKLEK